MDGPNSLSLPQALEAIKNRGARLVTSLDQLTIPRLSQYADDLLTFTNMNSCSDIALSVDHSNPGLIIGGVVMALTCIEILRSRFLLWESKWSLEHKLEFLSEVEQRFFNPDAQLKAYWENKKIFFPDLDTSPGSYEDVPKFDFKETIKTKEKLGSKFISTILPIRALLDPVSSSDSTPSRKCHLSAAEALNCLEAVKKSPERVLSVAEAMEYLELVRVVKSSGKKPTIAEEMELDKFPRSKWDAGHWLYALREHGNKYGLWYYPSGEDLRSGDHTPHSEAFLNGEYDPEIQIHNYCPIHKLEAIMAGFESPPQLPLMCYPSLSDSSSDEDDDEEYESDEDEDEEDASAYPEEEFYVHEGKCYYVLYKNEDEGEYDAESEWEE